jgi:zinc/manganese transport system permease protein
VFAGLSPLIEPGFFSNPAVRTALLVGGVAAVVSAIVGTFTVIRGQSFAGHSLADVGSAGGAGAFLVGASPLWGFIAMNLVAAGAMELLGIRRPRSRDVGTGIVLAASLGLAALFLYWDTTWTSNNGATFSVLFGSIFTLQPSLVPYVVGLGVLAVGVVGLLWRPLLLTSLNPDLAAARGVSVRLIGIGFLAALALAVSLSAITIGAILSTALLIGPAATALRIARSSYGAVSLAMGIGVATTWLAILLSYDTADWTNANWPVSFFVVALSFSSYVVVDSVVAFRARRTSRTSRQVA